MNVSTASAQALVRGLVRAGVEDFIVSPGSRSAPLAYAIGALAEAGRVRAHVRIDERDAGFTALGIAKAGRLAGRERPVAVVTTSGSAVGNLHPAIMEAAYQHLPLIAVTADRPARLRATGANQTLDAQHRSLPEVVAAWDVHVPGPERRKDFFDSEGPLALTAVAGGREADACAKEGLAVKGVHTALGVRLAPGCGAGDEAWVTKAAELGVDPCGSGDLRLDDALPGPVQLNVQFDLPLVPEAEDLDPDRITGVPATIGGAPAPRRSDSPAEPDGAPYAAPVPFVPRPADSAELLDQVRAALQDPGTHPVVVAGDDLGFATSTVWALAEDYGLPVFAEPSTASASHPHAIPDHARVLSDAGGVELAAAISHVVVSGKPTLSRPVAALLDRRDVERFDLPHDLDGPGVNPSPDVVRPGPSTARAPAASIGPSADERDSMRDARVPSLTPGRERWLADWQTVAERRLAGPTRGEPDAANAATLPPHARESPAARPTSGLLDGPSVARMLLERPGMIFAASSNAVRYLASAQRRRHPARVLASRGLAGIDGLVATAGGVALGLEDAPARTELPVRLLVGDLAALHDLGGLVIPTHERRPRLQIIVLNDDGGAIFSGLEHSAEHLRPYFDRFFGTPHGRGLAEAARALGWSAQTGERGAEGTDGALGAFLDSGRAGLFELRLR